MKKTFLLGVGAQKCGTTWLHTYLRKHKNTNMGITKEYHVFDTFFGSEFPINPPGLSKIKTIEMYDGMKSPFFKRFLTFKKFQKLKKRIYFLNDINHYFDYFQHLANKNKHTHLVGDITPSYACLPLSAFQFINDELTSRNFTVKVIFLMREPVYRIWSSIKMERRRLLEKEPNKPFSLTEIEMLLKKYKSKSRAVRTCYETTIQNLEQVFPKENILYHFHETLFQEKALKEIVEFLHLDYKKPNLHRTVKKTPCTETCDEKIIEEITRYYQNTYHFAAEKFGKQFIADIWPSYHYLNNSISS